MVRVLDITVIRNIIKKAYPDSYILLDKAYIQGDVYYLYDILNMIKGD